ncbi:MAG: hypothetical protein LWY06_01005 [Firmicutes bacterium]|nr:hypothetical protein [Bacillota bacterium]
MSESKFYSTDQFLFIRPGKKNVKVLIGETENKEEIIVSEPSIFSKLNRTLQLEEGDLFRSSYSIPLLQTGVCVTDRKVYKPGDDVTVFAFFPNPSSQEATLSINKNGRLFSSEKIQLCTKGTYSDVFKAMPEGSYEFEIENSEGFSHTCSFTVAEYTLSFMRATLLSHKYDAGSDLSYKISIILGDVPCTEKVKVGLYCGYCEVVVDDQEVNCSKEGIAEGKFTLSGHTGPFSFHITTPAGESATIFLPGSTAGTREQIEISNLGETIMGGIMPDDSRPERVRGLYIGSTGSKSSPVVIENIVTDKAILTFTEDLEAAAVDVLNPVDGTVVQINRTKIKRGEKLEINTPYPFGFIFAGTMGKDCYQGFSLLIKPPEMDLEIEMPEKAKPGEEIEITVTSNRKGRLMLIAADSRLQSDDPYDIFAEQHFSALKNGIQYAFSGFVNEYAPYKTLKRMGSRGFADAEMLMAPPPPPMQFPSPGGMMMAALPMEPVPSMDTEMEVTSLGERNPNIAKILMGYKPEVEEDNESQVAPATTRLDFPHLIFAKLIDFDSTHTEKVKLGDQIGAFKVFAFIIDGFDFISASKQVETTQEVYLELDVPALMAPGDEIIGKVYAKCPDNGKLTVTAALTRLEKSVKGSQNFEIKLKSAGEVFGELDSPSGKDVTGKTIKTPGKETITRSKIIWLNPGEKLKADKIIVYPNVGHLLNDSAKALVQYPFGCAEQTSAKMFGLALVYRAMKKGIISNGFQDVERKLMQGADRMKLFFRDDSFSLWENGTPSDYVTVQVLSNLRPLWQINFGDTGKMTELAAANLIKKKYKDNRLVEYNKAFAGEMKTVRDAVSFYKRGLEKEKAVQLLREKAEVSTSTAIWKDETCWAGPAEATCLALQVMQHEDSELFNKGFSFVSSGLQEGRLYSTTDTAAFLELLSNMEGKNTGSAIIDGKQINLASPVICTEVEAMEKTLIRVDEETEVDYLTPSSNFKGEISIERTSFKTGEKVNLVIKPLEDSLAPLARIYLPGNTACLESGAGIQKMYVPIKSDTLKLELYGIRKGRGKLQVALMDMYDSEKTGVLPGLTLTVS